MEGRMLMSYRIRLNIRWLILSIAAILLFVGGFAKAAVICGTSLQIESRTPTQFTYDHCTVSGEDATGTLFSQDYPVPPEGDAIVDFSDLIVNLQYPIIFSAACYSSKGVVGIAAEPTGRCDGVGQPEFLGIVP